MHNTVLAPHYPFKKKIVFSAGEGIEKRELSYIVAGNVNWYSHYGETVWRFLIKPKIELPNDSYNPTPRYLSGENSNSKRFMNPCSQQHYSQ